MDVTPQSILDVRFREKVRGYHPADVDEFVSQMAAAVQDLQRRAAAAEARLVEVESRGGGNEETQESLRRTLVLAQRTADLAIEEARQEAARLVEEAQRQHDGLVAEMAELKAKMYAQSEEEVREERERLYAVRDSLRADVDALATHMARERERLRIYFSDQLRRVEEGEPGVSLVPPMQAPDRRQSSFVDGEDEDEGPGPGSPDGEGGGGPAAAMDDGPVGGDSDPEGAAGDDDPFLAELRRAATDEEPLGPRDSPPPADDADGFDLFAPNPEESGRFGSRRRRRK